MHLHRTVSVDSHLPQLLLVDKPEYTDLLSGGPVPSAVALAGEDSTECVASGGWWRSDSALSDYDDIQHNAHEAVQDPLVHKSPALRLLALAVYRTVRLSWGFPVAKRST